MLFVPISCTYLRSEHITSHQTRQETDHLKKLCFRARAGAIRIQRLIARKKVSGIKIGPNRSKQAEIEGFLKNVEIMYSRIPRPSTNTHTRTRITHARTRSRWCSPHAAYFLKILVRRQVCPHASCSHQSCKMPGNAPTPVVHIGVVRDFGVLWCVLGVFCSLCKCLELF